VTEPPEQETGPGQGASNGSAPRGAAPSEPFRPAAEPAAGADSWARASREQWDSPGGQDVTPEEDRPAGPGREAGGSGQAGRGRAAGPGRQAGSGGAGRQGSSGGRQGGGGAGRRADGRDARGRQFSSDLTAELQRWLLRSGATSVRKEFAEQVRKTLRGGKAEPGDVWETATTEPPPGEQFQSPECAWCPICQAARRVRESGPGLGSRLAGAGDAVAAAVQEALSAFDSILSANPARPPKRPPASQARRAGTADQADAARPADPASQADAGGVADGSAADAGSAAGTGPAQAAGGAPGGAEEGLDSEPDDRR
jgi:hypothetical protein